MSSEVLTTVGEDHQSYAFIEYFLRLSLHSSTAKITALWEVSNPQLSLQFEKRCKVSSTQYTCVYLGRI
jgi:hypothetical protein